MSVARFSCPQFFDPSLRTPQHSVYEEGVGISCYLRHDPRDQPHQRLGQCVLDPEGPLEGGERYFHLLPFPILARALGHQSDPDLCQLLLQLLAAVCQVPEEPPCRILPESRFAKQFAHQADLRDVGSGELVGDGDAVGRADEVKLHPVDAERAPPHPPSALETRRLRDLSWAQHLQERGVYEEGLGISHQIGEDLSAQSLHSKRRSFLRRRWKEEGARSTTPGNSSEKKREASLRKDRSLSRPRSCWKRARVRISESESFLSAS